MIPTDPAALRAWIQEQQKVCAAATPGPWERACGRTSEAVVAVGRKYDSVEQVRYDGSPVAITDTEPHCGSSESQNNANAEFIATFNPSVITSLLARLLELSEERDDQDRALIDLWKWQEEGAMLMIGTCDAVAKAVKRADLKSQESH